MTTTLHPAKATPLRPAHVAPPIPSDHLAAARSRLSAALAHFGYAQTIFDRFTRPGLRARYLRRGTDAESRMAVWRFMREPYGGTVLSYPEIGAVCNCNHTTVLEAVKPDAVKARKRDRRVESKTRARRRGGGGGGMKAKCIGQRSRLGKAWDAKRVEWDDDSDLSDSGEWFLSPDAQLVLDKHSEPSDVPDVGPEYGAASVEIW